MEISNSEQALTAQNEIGRNRPVPSFAPVPAAALDAKLHEHAGAANKTQLGAPNYAAQPDAGTIGSAQSKAQVDETVLPLPHVEPSTHTIPVEEVLFRLREIGIEKSKDSIQRYCREGALDCQKLGLFRRYFATEESLDALIIRMQPDEDARVCIQPDAPASFRDIDKTTHMDAPAPNSSHLHQPESEPRADPDSQLKASGDEALVDFLKEEIRVKNKQLEGKDTQIAAMLERDHETNILIRGLQNHLGETFAMLAGRSNREENKDETGRDFRN